MSSAPLILILAGAAILAFYWWSRRHDKMGDRDPIGDSNRVEFLGDKKVYISQETVESTDTKYTGNVEIYDFGDGKTKSYEIERPDGTLSRTGRRPSDDPVARYFASFERIEDLKRWGDYHEAFNVAFDACRDIPAFVDDSIELYGNFVADSSPPLEYCCTFAAVHQDDAHLEELSNIIGSRSALAHWASVVEDARRDLADFKQIKDLVAQQPGVVQKTIYKTLRIEGGRGSNLLYWADKFGLISREKQGNSYALTLADGPESVMLGEIFFAEDERTCQAVRRYDGRLFHPDELPKLPVPGCDAETCRCVYGWRPLD